MATLNYSRQIRRVRMSTCSVMLVYGVSIDVVFAMDFSQKRRESIIFLQDFFGEGLITQPLWPARSPDLTPPDFFFMGFS